VLTVKRVFIPISIDHLLNKHLFEPR